MSAGHRDADLAAIRETQELHAAELAKLNEKLDRALELLQRLDVGQDTIVLRLNRMHQQPRRDFVRDGG